MVKTREIGEVKMSACVFPAHALSIFFILFSCALTLADEGIRTFRAGKEEESPPGDSGCPAQAKNYRLGRFHIRKRQCASKTRLQPRACRR